MEDSNLYGKMMGCVDTLPLLSDLRTIIGRYVAYPDYLVKVNKNTQDPSICGDCKLPLLYPRGKRLFRLTNGKIGMIVCELLEVINYYKDLGHKLMDKSEYCSNPLHMANTAGYFVTKCTDPKCDKYRSSHDVKCFLCNTRGISHCVIWKDQYLDDDPSKFMCLYLHMSCVDGMDFCGDDSFDLFHVDDVLCRVH